MSANVPTSDEFAALQARVEALEAQLAAREQPEWLNLADASRYVGRSESATYKLVTRLGLKHQEVAGGRIQIRRAELDAALATRNRRSTDDPRSQQADPDHA